MTKSVTLNPDVAQRVEQEVRRAGKPAQAVVNDALRSHFGLERKISTQEPFDVKPHDFSFAAGLDLDKMSQLVDSLEAAEALQSASEARGKE
jgi:hypothetical protein